jgi:hypothetical protein
VDFLSADFLKALTPWSLLLLLVLLNLLGYIRPARAVREARDYGEKLADQAVTEADRWRAAYEHSEQARERMAEGLREALEVARTATAAVEGLRLAVDKADRDRDGGR